MLIPKCRMLRMRVCFQHFARPPSGATERGRANVPGRFVGFAVTYIRRNVFLRDFRGVVWRSLGCEPEVTVVCEEMVRKWEGYVEGMEVKKEKACMTSSSSSSSLSLWSIPFSLSPSRLISLHRAGRIRYLAATPTSGCQPSHPHPTVSWECGFGGHCPPTLRYMEPVPPLPPSDPTSQ